ncbi:MAG: homoserine/homoserine lactone efflux protein [Proteobacteria bacterium]|nr:MAG: homoserine/homoserine lactone efflux protein [Pseudomonadota bacterium]
MPLDTWLTMLLTALAISISPGAGAVTAMSYGLTHGARNAFSAVLGLQCGFITQIVVVGIGLGGLIAASVTLFTTVKWIGVGYLIYLGLRKWREGGELKLGRVTLAFSHRRAFFESVLVNLTNPKSLVFLVALMPQFIDPHADQAQQIAIIGATLIAVDVAVMSGYSTLASRLRSLLRNEKAVRLQNRITGGVLIGAGLLLASTDNRR